MNEQTEAQRQAAFAAAGQQPVPAGTPPVYTTANLTPATPVVVPPAPVLTSGEQMRGSVDGTVSAIDSALKSLQEPSKIEGEGTTLRNEILTSLETLAGRDARKIALEKEKGLPGMTEQLQGISNELQTLQKESIAIPLQVQEEFKGTGATKGGVEPIQAGRLRQNAIRTLTLAAMGQTLQGNIALAQSQVAQAIKLEFEPKEARLSYLRDLYAFNREDLQREDKKRADAIGRLLDERSRLLELEKTNKNEIYNVGLTAQKFGADTGTVKKIFDAKTREEAVAAAGKFLTDPKAKIELQNAILDTELKKLQMAKIRKETSLLGLPTPTEKKELEKIAKEEKKAMEQAKTAIPLVQSKIDQIDAVLSSSALDSVVGPNALSRAPTGVFGRLGAAFQGGLVGGAAGGAGGFLLGGIGAIPGALYGAGAGALAAGTQGLFDELSGSRQNFIANVDQLTSKEFIDTLISAKASGASFGALSESEQRALQAAATKFDTWREKDGDKTIGFNASEADFKAELEKIKQSANLVMTRLQGDALSSDERDSLDAIFSLGGAALTPGLNYYK